MRNAYFHMKIIVKFGGNCTTHWLVTYKKILNFIYMLFCQEVVVSQPKLRSYEVGGVFACRYC